MTAMRKSKRQFGLTLTELVVTVAIIAVLLALAVPAAKRLSESFQGGAGAHGLISAALSNARAIAARQGTYAGLWFHQDNDNKTSMVFMVHDYERTGYANGFRAVDGRKAVILPEGVQAYVKIDNAEIDNEYNRNFLFPIVFNSAGKLVIHPVRYLGENSMSVNRFNILNTGPDGSVRTLMVNPYTGELVGQQ